MEAIWRKCLSAGFWHLTANGPKAMADFEIREGSQADSEAIDSLYPQAFPDEDLLPLVRELAQNRVTTISLAAVIDGQIVGHAIFTRCGLDGSDASAALLGPVAVAPAWQRQGIGSALIRFGIQRLKDENVALVYVLGDPAYYGRLGFVPESLVEPPFQLPREWAEAWQSLCLDSVVTPIAGKLIVPPPWMQPALWAP